jgi:hypothetical protein
MQDHAVCEHVVVADLEQCPQQAIGLIAVLGLNAGDQRVESIKSAELWLSTAPSVERPLGFDASGGA